MSIILIKILQFIFSLSIIVSVHELGHFLGALICKTRVDKFYLFFNPWFSLFKKKVNHTTYGVGWIPVGGYVKIAGMIDESMDKKQLEKDPEQWEYRSKKPWQKLIMITGGVIFNFFLSWLIYVFIFVGWGESYIDATKIPYGITVDSEMRNLGFQDGDYILALDGEKVENFATIPLKIITDGVRKVTIKRDEKIMEISLPEDFAVNMLSNKNTHFIGIRQARQPIDSVATSSTAKLIGLKKGDEIVSFNGEPIRFNDELRNHLKAHKNKKIILTIKRVDSVFSTSPFTADKDVLGVSFSVPLDGRQGIVKNSYNVFTALPKGFEKSTTVLFSYWSQLKLLVGGKVNVNENMGGMISMGKIFPSEWDWQRFWGLTAFLSLIIGLINILPIPALDGGHAVIIIIEWIMGKPLPCRTQETIQTVGFILLIGLMAYSQGLDILRLFKN